jgi:hypothetical protein
LSATELLQPFEGIKNGSIRPDFTKMPARHKTVETLVAFAGKLSYVSSKKARKTI